MKPIKPLYILGIGATALEIAEAAYLTGEWSNVYCVASTNEAIKKADPQKIDFNQFEALLKSSTSPIHYLYGMTSIPYRKTWESALSQSASKLQSTTIIHPNSVISRSATIGAGSYIAAGVVVSVNAIVGEFCLINYNVTIGHDVRIGNHTSINPGASIGGHVEIGERCLVGANSFIFQGKKIGPDSQIDAMTYVDRNIEPNQLVTSRGELKILPRRA